VQRVELDVPAAEGSGESRGERRLPGARRADDRDARQDQGNRAIRQIAGRKAVIALNGADVEPPRAAGSRWGM
jgi:hypothetical protein